MESRTKAKSRSFFIKEGYVNRYPHGKLSYLKTISPLCYNPQMASPEISPQIAQEPQKPPQERSFQNTIDFLAEATPTSIDLRTPWPPRHKCQTETDWQRNFTIAGRYLGTDTTL